MEKGMIFLAMVFCHIADDFYLQGPLAKFKQKTWWEKHYPDENYKGDYRIALILHAFSWTFMIHLPLMSGWLLRSIYPGATLFFGEFLFNMIIHAITDHQKANKLKINLTQDQLIHMVQIIGTFLLYMIME